MIELVEFAGWAGTGLIVLGYGLVSSGRVDGKSILYQLMNLFGALGLGLNLWVAASWPAFTLQVVWGLIAVLALIHIFVRR